jgi:Fur family transcriptional regulator, iron response regulator
MKEKSLQNQGRGIPDLLRKADLRPTRQRKALASLLFGGPNRHVSAELLHDEVTAIGEHVSLATVYNTLHQFRRAGLLREIAIDGAKSYFDTDTSNHHHFLIEPEGLLMDIPDGSLKIDGIPKAPEGMRITHIDVVVRVTKT